MALAPTCCLLAIACGPVNNNTDTTQPDAGGPDAVQVVIGCEGGLVEIDGECVALTHGLDVLLFRAPAEPSARTCARTFISDDPGINEAVVASSANCRVFDTDRYGPLNYEPAPRVNTVSVTADGGILLVNEAELFDSCVERRTVSADFFTYGGEFAIGFPGNDVIPPFEETLVIPSNPTFSRGAVVDGEPLLFTWTPTAADSVQATLSSGAINIVCQASTDAGRLEVPADLMALLPEPEPPRTEPFTSIRLRNEIVIPFIAEDARAILTADTYQSTF